MPDVERNDRGWRIGENHPRAKLTDAVVCELRDLHEQKGIRYAQLVELLSARGIETTERTVKAICNYTRRTQGRSMGAANG